MLYQWCKLDKTIRGWRLYGLFCGLMCVGSCCGAVAWMAWMQYLVLVFREAGVSFELSSLTTLTAKTDCLFYNRTYHISLKECRECDKEFNKRQMSKRFECKYNLLNSATLSRDGVTSQAFYQQASAYFYLSIQPVPYSLEFLCMSVAKLLVLHRMLHLALGKVGEGSQRWFAAGRIMMGVIIAGNLVGISSNIATAVFDKQASDSFSALAAALQAKDAQGINSFINSSSIIDAFQSLENVDKTYSVQQFCEVLLLLLILVAFAVVGAKCAHRMRVVERHLHADANPGSSRTMQLRGDVAGVRRQIFATVFVVFLTFLLRAVYSTMFALANFGQNSGDGKCEELCGSGCNQYSNMRSWIVLNPEFQLVIILISSPVTMCVTLWGMTTERALRLLVPCRRQASDGVALNPMHA